MQRRTPLTCSPTALWAPGRLGRPATAAAFAVFPLVGMACGGIVNGGDGTTDASGSGKDASTDGSLADAGAAQDATFDHVGRDAGAIDSDAGVSPMHGSGCPDAGVITIEGDGLPQTLRSNSTPPVFYFKIPPTPWAQVYDGQGLAIGGSENPDGGAILRFDIEIAESPDGGLTVLGPDSVYSYAYYTRQDGTLFSPTSATAASITLTEVDLPGGVVAGSYTVTVVDSEQADAASLSLSGTFLTCRLRDFSGPTPTPSP
jgi:hypothetical protein